MEPLRLGLLGAARISDIAVIQPAGLTGARLVAVAARDPQRAAAFAEQHGIERVQRRTRTSSTILTSRWSTTRWPTACTARGT